MDKKQFEEMKGVQDKTLEAITGLTEVIKTFSVKPAEEPAPEPKPAEEPNPEPKPEEGKTFSALKETQEKTLTAINSLTEAFQALKQEAPAPKPPAGNGIC